MVANYKKDCESVPIFRTFCDQINSFTNATSKLQRHNFIQSWIDFIVMILTILIILQTNFVNNIQT